jgi:hypothetical protein
MNVIGVKEILCLRRLAGAPACSSGRRDWFGLSEDSTTVASRRTDMPTKGMAAGLTEGDRSPAPWDAQRNFRTLLGGATI